MTLPILYSFRRCPYAMRARMALVINERCVAIREISLKNKPEAFLSTSPKGTVPVLVLTDGQVIDESLDIMNWAATKQEGSHSISDEPLVKENDQDFARRLTRYKYFERYPENSQQDYFEQCLPFLDSLESKLSHGNFLKDSQPSLLDIAIFPFIRQFKKIDEGRFEGLSHSKLKKWTDYWLNSEVLEKAMKKYPLWDGKADTTSGILS